jgi:hypothetical protein
LLLVMLLVRVIVLVRVMVLESIRPELLWFKLVLFSIPLVNVQTMGCHLPWFPTGRTDGGPPIFDMGTIGCQLFRFPLIRQNNWQPKHICIFWHII